MRINWLYGIYNTEYCIFIIDYVIMAYYSMLVAVVCYQCVLYSFYISKLDNKYMHMYTHMFLETRC